MATYRVMAKRCGFCDFAADDETAFAGHLRTVHRWAASGTAPTAVAAAPTAEQLAVPRFCGNCGAPRDAESTKFCRNCGVAFEGAGTAAAEPQASLAFAPKGGFWRRSMAYFVDTIFLVVVGAVVGVVIGSAGEAANVPSHDVELLSQAIGQILGLAYFLYFWTAWGDGQTPGMRLLGLRVIRTDGALMSVGRAFLRYIGLGISILAVLIGVIWVAFDRNKQGWHDKIADTYVIRAARG